MLARWRKGRIRLERQHSGEEQGAGAQVGEKVGKPKAKLLSEAVQEMYEKDDGSGDALSVRAGLEVRAEVVMVPGDLSWSCGLGVCHECRSNRLSIPSG